MQFPTFITGTIVLLMAYSAMAQSGRRAGTYVTTSNSVICRPSPLRCGGAPGNPCPAGKQPSVDATAAKANKAACAGKAIDSKFSTSEILSLAFGLAATILAVFAILATIHSRNTPRTPVAALSTSDSLTLFFGLAATILAIVAILATLYIRHNRIVLPPRNDVELRALMPDTAAAASPNEHEAALRAFEMLLGMFRRGT
ncbi:hypothetical protein VTL71DRAFT_4826 [Oculimacula yallundae]|uniref:Uncharacterized protein n=1 Tax=Oculimacula yallundae TaxID=86028 RepID=A0ABR4C3Q8_9HELO